jgi:hypothetical protein
MKIFSVRNDSLLPRKIPAFQINVFIHGTIIAQGFYCRSIDDCHVGVVGEIAPVPCFFFQVNIREWQSGRVMTHSLDGIRWPPLRLISKLWNSGNMGHAQRVSTLIETAPHRMLRQASPCTFRSKCMASSMDNPHVIAGPDPTIQRRSHFGMLRCAQHDKNERHGTPCFYMMQAGEP